MERASSEASAKVANANAAIAMDAEKKLVEATDDFFVKKMKKSKTYNEYEQAFLDNEIQKLAKIANINAADYVLQDNTLKVLKERAKVEWDLANKPKVNESPKVTIRK